MTARAGATGKIARVVALRVVIAFLLVKALIAAFPDGWQAQALVPVLLVLMTLGDGDNLHWKRVWLSFQAPRDWADVVCALFFAFPLLATILVWGHSSVSVYHSWHLWLMSGSAVFSIILAPIAEEFFFRGWLLERQLKGQTPQGLLSVSAQLKVIYLNALVFWLMHAPADFMLWKEALAVGAFPLSPGPFFLGLVSAMLALKTGNLRAATLFHAIANSHGPLWSPLLKYDWLRELFYQ